MRNLAENSAREPELAPTSVSGTVRVFDDDCELERYGLRFQTQRKLATGGMASVVHAFDPLLGRHIAVKLLHSSLVQQAGEIDAFLREARVTAQLEHPNIVPVYDLASGASSDWACFAMKLVQGESLADHLAELGDARLAPNELTRLLEVLLKVCDAIDYAHSRRVLHLDLKPQNIMVGSHGQVYVVDWGIAVRCSVSVDGRLAPIDRHASMRGTLAYMAPEQLDNELSGVDERADVYGLGAILYEVLTGKPPFPATGERDDIARLREHVVVDASVAAAPLHVPSRLARIVARALAKRPEDRYANVAELRAELESLARGHGWFELRSFAPGEFIVREGEVAHEAFVLMDGACDVLKQSGASFLHLRCMQRGEAFGEASILARATRTASVRAKTHVRVMVVTRESLEWELSSMGMLGTFVRSLAQRFREADDERALQRVRLAELSQALERLDERA